MRLNRLDLTAFGHFTELQLPLPRPVSGTSDLHLIVGPNEAGKSTLLRALSNLLFGFQHLETDDFLHPKTKLRIGAEVEGAQGERLTLQRRRGNKQTLRDRNDDPLDEGQLQRLLGIERTLFEQLFGLDLERLQRGGEALAQGGGELGRALYEAGSGLQGLHPIQRQLHADYLELFKKTGSKPRINDAIRRYTESHKAADKALLKGAAWRQLEANLQASRQQVTELEAARRTLLEESQRLGRIQRIRPRLEELARLQAALDALGSLPPLPADATQQRTEAQARLATHRAQRTPLCEQEQALKAQLEAPTGDLRALGLAEPIELLRERYGSYQKDAHDLPKLRLEHAAQVATCQGLLDRLGLTASAEAQAIRALLPALDATEQLRESLRRHAALMAQRETTEEQLRRSAQPRPKPESDAPLTSESLQSEVARISALGPLETQLDARRVGLLRRAQQLQERLSRTLHWCADSDALRQIPLPEREQVEAWQGRWQPLDEALRDARRRQEEIDAQLTRLNDALQQLRRRGEPPTRERWAARRQERDDAFTALFTQWQTGTPPAPSALAEALGLVQSSDQLAEQLLDSAEEAARYSQLLHEERELRQQQAAQGALIARHEAEQATIMQALHAALAPARGALLASFTLHRPGDLSQWLERRAQLLDEADALAAGQLELTQAEAQIDRLRDGLATELAIPPTQGLAATLALAQQRIAQSEQARDAERSWRSEERARLQGQEQAQATLTRLDHALAALVTQWREPLAALGLPHASTTAQIEHRLDLWRQLAHANDTLAIAEGRHLGVARQMAEFATALQQLCAQLDLDGGEPTLGIQRLREALEQARGTQQARAALEGKASEIRQRREQLDEQIAHDQATLDGLCRIAGVDRVEALPEIEQRREQHAQLSARQQAVQQFIDAASEGRPAQVLAEECAAGPDEASLTLRIEQLTAAIAANDSALAKAREQSGRHQAEYDAADGRATAADHAAEAAMALAEVRQLSERYVHLVLAEQLLKRTIARYREENQDPLLSRASAHFAQLTLGGFTRLYPEQEGAEARLLAQRRSGERLGVEGMSTGTLDQLYLALRLAAIERHLDAHPAVPLVLDDILVQFDDARANAALTQLAALSRRTQVLYFTHHDHLEQLAKAQLPEGSFRVHHLPNPGARS